MNPTDVTKRIRPRFSIILKLLLAIEISVPNFSVTRLEPSAANITAPKRRATMNTPAVPSDTPLIVTLPSR